MTDKDQIQPIITAYLSGKATAEERSKLDDWVKQSPDNDRYYQEMRNIWQVMHPAFTPSAFCGVGVLGVAHICFSKKSCTTEMSQTQNPLTP